MQRLTDAFSRWGLWGHPETASSTRSTTPDISRVTPELELERSFSPSQDKRDPTLVEERVREYLDIACQALQIEHSLKKLFSDLQEEIIRPKARRIPDVERAVTLTELRKQSFPIAINIIRSGGKTPLKEFYEKGKSFVAMREKFFSSSQTPDPSLITDCLAFVFNNKEILQGHSLRLNYSCDTLPCLPFSLLCTMQPVSLTLECWEQSELPDIFDSLSLKRLSIIESNLTTLPPSIERSSLEEFEIQKCPAFLESSLSFLPKTLKKIRLDVHFLLGLLDKNSLIYHLYDKKTRTIPNSEVLKEYLQEIMFRHFKDTITNLQARRVEIRWLGPCLFPEKIFLEINDWYAAVNPSFDNTVRDRRKIISTTLEGKIDPTRDDFFLGVFINTPCKKITSI